VRSTRTSGGAALLVLLLAGAIMPVVAGGEVVPAGEPTLNVSSRIVPARLPSAHRVPVALRMSFQFEGPEHTVPELTSLALEISRNVALRTKGLPSCSLAKLLSSYASPLQSCAGSLVGHGRVISEVTLPGPGQRPVTVDGRLLAFYAFAEGRPRILAKVTSSGELPLTYVIPFRIETSHGIFGTRLHVRKMSNILGMCARGHPDCFAQPYRLKGIYGHISDFELSLHRIFVAAGKRTSFVSAYCPARGPLQIADLQFGVSVRYKTPSTRGGEGTTQLLRCKVAR
jgi:hypothetical protein